MKSQRRTLALILAGALVAPPLPAFAPVPARTAAVQGRHDEFLAEFKNAMKINARDEMAKLMKSYADEAVARIVFTCEQIADQNSEELELLIDALRQAWSTAYSTGFVDIEYRYFSFLDAAFKRERKTLKKRYDAAIARYATAVAAKDQVELELIGGELESLANGFETVGDRYYASETWYMFGNCFDEVQRGNKADLKKVAVGYGNALDHRAAIELVGKTTNELKTRYQRLIAEGWVEGEAGLPPTGAVPGEPGTTPAAAAIVPLTVGMSFEVIDDIEAFERPSYTADDLYAMWGGLQFQKKGSKATFLAMKESPELHRVGSSDVRVDLNRDGSAEDDDKVPITGKFVPVEVTLGKGPEERPWAFLCVTGLEQDTFQGIQMNLQPNDDQMFLYAVNAASMVGTVGTTPVRVIDDNMDGIYGSLPLMWAHSGLTDDMLQPEMDSIVIGDSKRAVPWSEYMKVGGQWYKFESAKGGNELVATPATIRSGTLKLDFKGGKPSWIVVRGSNKFENCYYDLVGQKTVEVPVGQYSLYYGELRKGKKRQTVKCLILPGATTPKWTVAEGETATVELGSPFGFDFNFRREDETLTVKGDSVVVVGKSDERYERAWNAVPRPEVSWRKQGSKRGSKGEEMDVVLDNQGINELGWDAAWGPLDATLKLNLDENETVEVQLVEKKNPLFGKVESEWKSGK